MKSKHKYIVIDIVCPIHKERAIVTAANHKIEIKTCCKDFATKCELVRLDYLKKQRLKLGR